MQPVIPFFTIITITKDNAAGLQKTWKLLMSQTCTDYEWIVIDGNSSDGTKSLLKFTDAKWVSEPDNGIYDAMNKGIDKAAGDWLLFLNAGDTLYDPYTLDTLHQFVKGTHLDFVYADSSENGYLKPARSHTHINQNMFTHHQAMLYRRAALGSIRYNTTYKIAADYDFTARLLKKTQNALHLPLPICTFEPGGTSHQNASLGRREQFKIRKNLKLVSMIENIGIYVGQSILWFARRNFSSLYWRWKSSGNTARGLEQTASP